MSLRTQKQNTIIGIGVLGMGLWYLSTKGDSPKAAKNPALTYARTETLTESQEDDLIKALFAQVNLGGAGSLDGTPITPEQFAKAMLLLEEAIAYYPNRPEKKMEEVKENIFKNKEKILKAYYAAQPIGMGPISGFSGVY
jgi:hypothetical protein